MTKLKCFICGSDDNVEKVIMVQTFIGWLKRSNIPLCKKHVVWLVNVIRAEKLLTAKKDEK